MLRGWVSKHAIDTGAGIVRASTHACTRAHVREAVCLRGRRRSVDWDQKLKSSKIDAPATSIVKNNLRDIPPISHFSCRSLISTFANHSTLASVLPPLPPSHLHRLDLFGFLCWSCCIGNKDIIFEQGCRHAHGK